MDSNTDYASLYLFHLLIPIKYSRGHSCPALALPLIRVPHACRLARRSLLVRAIRRFSQRKAT